nr:hypothetical protein P5665_06020 [Bacillus subtilis]
MAKWYGNQVPWLMICMLFFILIEATVPLLQLYASKQVIDGVVKHDNAVNTEVWYVVYAGSLVMVGAVKSLETWVKTLLSERSMITVNTLLIDAFERIPGMRFFEDPAYRDKLETLRDRSTWLPSQFVNISSNLLTVRCFAFRRRIRHRLSFSDSGSHSLFVDSSICLCA